MGYAYLIPRQQILLEQKMQGRGGHNQSYAQEFTPSIAEGYMK